MYNNESNVSVLVHFWILVHLWIFNIIASLRYIVSVRYNSECQIKLWKWAISLSVINKCQCDIYSFEFDIYFGVWDIVVNVRYHRKCEI